MKTNQSLFREIAISLFGQNHFEILTKNHLKEERHSIPMLK